MLDELPGIDDAESEKRLRQEYLRRDSRRKRIAVLAGILLGTGFALGVASGILVVLGFRVAGTWVGSAFAGFVSAYLVIAWERSRIRKAWPSVAAAHGRCRNCGYILVPATADRCPECGEPVEPPSADTRED